MAPSASTRKPRASRAARKALCALCALACLSLASCDWIRNLFPESFGTEYSDTTTNFIAAHALAQPPLASDQGTGVALGSPAVWDWAWRGKAGNSFQYMTFTDAGTVGSAASSGTYTLAAGAPAWRLELVNLAGDPYLEGSFHSAWSRSGSGSFSQQISAISHGNFIRLLSSFENWAGFDPSVDFFILDNPITNPNATYLFKAHTFTKLPIRYIIDDPTAASFSEAESVTPYDNQVQFKQFSVTSGNRFMTYPVAQGTSQDLSIDDIRFVRTDIEDSFCYRLSLRPSDTKPALVAGRYEFSLWIRRPTDALYYDDDAGRRDDHDAPFASKVVTIEMRQVSFLDSQDNQHPFYDSFEVGSEWTRVAIRMGSSNLLRFDEGSTTPVVELSIFPFDRQDPEPGAVLIADPRLSFYLNGY